ncbi:hypothetical protein Tco_1438635 [Tanacetum coccineum]
MFDKISRLLKSVTSTLIAEYVCRIFKVNDMPRVPIYSSSEYDDDNDDGSQLADENKESYRKETRSNDEDDVEIIAEFQKDERNEYHTTMLKCSEIKYDTRNEDYQKR